MKMICFHAEAVVLVNLNLRHDKCDILKHARHTSDIVLIVGVLIGSLQILKCYNVIAVNRFAQFRLTHIGNDEFQHSNCPDFHIAIEN